MYIDIQMHLYEWIPRNWSYLLFKKFMFLIFSTMSHSTRDLDFLSKDQTRTLHRKCSLNHWTTSEWKSLNCIDSLQPHGLYSPWNSPGQNTGVGSLSLLQGIFPAQGSNPGLPHCRRILYQLSYHYKYKHMQH